MKRFWQEVALEEGGDGWRIELDGRPVRTPARALLAVPTDALAQKRLHGNGAQSATRSSLAAMPLTGSANAAIDHVAPERRAFAQNLAKYGAGGSCLLSCRQSG